MLKTIKTLLVILLRNLFFRKKVFSSDSNLVLIMDSNSMYDSKKFNLVSLNKGYILNNENQLKINLF